jgi:hypothetical protein
MTFADAVAAQSRPNAYVLLNRRIVGANLLGFAGLGQLVGVIAGVGLGLAPLPFAALVLVPGPLVLALQAFWRRHLWPAHEAVLWLKFIGSDAWRGRFKDRAPVTAGQARVWLVRHPVSTTPDNARALVLLIAGRLTEAQELISRLPTSSAQERQARLALEFSLAVHELRPVDSTALNEALREDPQISESERVLRLGFHAALEEIDRGGEGIAPLLASRIAAGAMPRAFRPRMFLAHYRNVLASLAIGVWLLVATLVGMATAGGVVWF